MLLPIIGYVVAAAAFYGFIIRTAKDDPYGDELPVQQEMDRRVIEPSRSRRGGLPAGRPSAS